MSQKVYTCPSGATSNQHFTAPDFNGDSSGQYATYTSISWTSSHTATIPGRSPWLFLP